MPHLVVAATFQHVEKSDDVAFHVGMGVFDGIAYAGLCCQVDHFIEPAGGEQGLRGGTVSQVDAVKLEIVLPGGWCVCRSGFSRDLFLFPQTLRG